MFASLVGLPACRTMPRVQVSHMVHGSKCLQMSETGTVSLLIICSHQNSIVLPRKGHSNGILDICPYTLLKTEHCPLELTPV